MKKFLRPNPEVVRQILKDDGHFPNSNLFLLIYKQSFMGDFSASSIELTFEENNWKNAWRAGIFDYHHYHSNTHEVLGMYKGSAQVQLGGPSGIIVDLSRGDVIIIPAGVAHKCISANHDFRCVGAYPDGIKYDIKRGIPGERPAADDSISKVLLPEKDPAYGSDGPLILNWEIQ